MERLEEMAGNLFRVIQTTARIRNQVTSGGVERLAQAANQVGREVRDMIRSSGVAPEI